MSGEQRTTAIVVGASGGVGNAVALALQGAGIEVHGLDLRPSSDGIQNSHIVDVTDAVALTRVVDGIARQGGIDHLVYCVGYQVATRALGVLTPDAWRKMIAANLDGAFYAVNACLPHFTGAPSDVILLSSVSAMWPDQSGGAYQAAKAGLVALARAIGVEDRDRRIRASVLMPGLIDTPLLDLRPNPPSREIRAAALRPSDIADVCRWLIQLPQRVHVPELTILPTGLQAIGDSIEARFSETR
jgi:NAD(P)-dependent dehydrogenase (short-subunit alcohol dehydrogenase family)